jgi:4-amino-4-deoxy-L-arabinose transferase-like glycosyltransferase
MNRNREIMSSGAATRPKHQMWRPSTRRLRQPRRDTPLPYPLTRAGRLCLLLALAKLALLIPILGRYGWDRDELYFLAAGRHLALGYVDFPPLTAVAARLVDGAFGPSLISLRLLCSLMAVVAAVATGAVARELGASQRLQVLATAAWIVTPFGLGGAVLFHSTFLELAATALAMLAAVRLLARSEPRQWILLGLWGGIGLESKYTIFVPLAAFLAGSALWRRDLLLRREAALGVLIASGLLLPNAIWQIRNHWVSLDFASSQHAKTASDTPPLTYAAQQIAFLGAGAVLVVLGLIWLWRREHLRPLVLACAAPSMVFGLERGRPYYALPAMLPALAAGCLALAERQPRRLTLAGLATAHLAILAFALPLVVPILPTRQLVSTGTWDKSFWKDEIGWHELVAQTAAAWRSRTPAERAAGAIVAGNYGAAGALSLYGAAAGLPAPISGHL